ncbi:MAG: hypothetical protein JNK60_23350, partial [Acidobacteria bacterium]|nr:hypothetical protein [Acidobacteriota bacterium]
MTRIRPSRLLVRLRPFRATHLIALCLSLLAAAPAWAGTASTDGVFRFEKEEKLPARPGTRYLFPRAYSTAMVDLAALKTILAAAPKEGTSAARSNPLVLELPMPDGSFQRFAAMESSIMEEPLQERFPEIRTYSARGLDDPAASVRFDVTPWGFHAQILGPGGRVWIDPYRHGDTQNLLVYYTKDYTRTAPRQSCLFDEPAPARPGLAQVTRPSQAPAVPAVAVGTQLRTFRTAVGATGEYTAFYGGTVPGALAGIVTSINRITGVYEIDLAVRLQLVASETNVIFTNPATDPYTNTVSGAQLNVNHSTLSAAPPAGIGSANFDVGHMFTTDPGGGLAGLGVICDNGQK